MLRKPEYNALVITEWLRYLNKEKYVSGNLSEF